MAILSFIRGKSVESTAVQQDVTIRCGIAVASSLSTRSTVRESSKTNANCRRSFRFGDNQPDRDGGPKSRRSFRFSKIQADSDEDDQDSDDKNQIYGPSADLLMKLFAAFQSVYLVATGKKLFGSIGSQDDLVQTCSIFFTFCVSLKAIVAMLITNYMKNKKKLDGDELILDQPPLEFEDCVGSAGRATSASAIPARSGDSRRQRDRRYVDVNKKNKNEPLSEDSDPKDSVSDEEFYAIEPRPVKKKKSVSFQTRIIIRDDQFE